MALRSAARVADLGVLTSRGSEFPSPPLFRDQNLNQNGAEVIYVLLIYAYRPDPAPLRVFELTERASEWDE